MDLYVKLTEKNRGIGLGGFAVGLLLGGVSLLVFASCCHVDGKNRPSLTQKDEPPLLDKQPVVLKGIAPGYPVEMILFGKKGTVTLVLTVDTSGRVVDVAVQSASDPAFIRPAVDALYQWKFVPGTIRGVPVSFKVCQQVVFTPPIKSE